MTKKFSLMSVSGSFVDGVELLKEKIVAMVSRSGRTALHVAITTGCNVEVIEGEASYLSHAGFRWRGCSSGGYAD